jgi:hypothetical protein
LTHRFTIEVGIKPGARRACDLKDDLRSTLKFFLP